MPRRLRIAAPNVPMHIVQRGHNRSICFFERRDYRRYLDDLAELAVATERVLVLSDPKLGSTDAVLSATENEMPSPCVPSRSVVS